MYEFRNLRRSVDLGPTSGRIDSVNVVISSARIRPDTRGTTRSPFVMRSIRQLIRVSIRDGGHRDQRRFMPERRRCKVSAVRRRRKSQALASIGVWISGKS